MLKCLDPEELSLIGADIAAVGDIIAVVVAEKELNEDKEDPFEIANLAVLGDLLVLIGDTITLKAVLIQNQESDEKQEETESVSPLEEAQRLGTVSSWLYVISDIISLQGSLLELQQAQSE